MGLSDCSRIKQKYSKTKTNTTNLLLAGILDRVSLLLWAKTKDGLKNRNRPKIISKLFLDDDKEKITSFNSIEDFEKMKKRIQRSK